MASLLEEDRGSVKVLWNLAAIVASGVQLATVSGLRVHLFTRTRLACLSGCGSRKAELAARRSLRLGAQQSTAFLATRACGSALISGTSSGRRRESTNSVADWGTVDVV